MESEIGTGREFYCRFYAFFEVVQCQSHVYPTHILPIGGDNTRFWFAFLKKLPFMPPSVLIIKSSVSVIG